MSRIRLGKSKDGYLMHYSVGAVIKKDGKYLLIDRRAEPLGYASLAGHMEESENEVQALFRKVKEESGLEVKSYHLLFEEDAEDNLCSRGVMAHHWCVFECEAEGELKLYAVEEKSIGWYSVEEMKKLNLEPMWKYWFGKMGVL